MGLKGQKEHFDDVAQSKEGKEMSFFFFSRHDAQQRAQSWLEKCSDSSLSV